MNKKVLTLCLIHDNNRVLLGMKKRGFGAGRWNGFGGKVEPGETIEEGAKREVLEECGIEAKDLEKFAVIEFEFKDDPVILEGHLFRGMEFSGEPKETEEMRPQWFLKDAIPFADMWPDDKHWFPLFLAGKKFKGKFNFEGQDKIVSHEIIEVQEI